MKNRLFIKEWIRFGKEISWKLNFYSLFTFLYRIKPCDFFYRGSLKEHKLILSYLKKDLSDVIGSYRSRLEIDGNSVTSSKIIWLLWWQGDESMPPLVRACIESTKKNANGAEVILITKNNFLSYIDIPLYILEKHKNGQISLAQLSDIIRYSLIEKYGGLWLDATIYTGHLIPAEIFNYNFFIWHTEQEKNCYVQQNDYHGFIVGSKRNEKLVSFVREMLYEYWKRHDILIDYFLVDYLVYIGKQSFPEIMSEIDSLPKMSKRIYEMKAMLDQAYDKNKFEELTNACLFSKLDWHKKYMIVTNRGEDTLYSILIRK